VKVVFHPRVVSELKAIIKYYEEVADATLADEFYNEFRRRVAYAVEHPEYFSDRVGKFKRVNLKKFPYNFLFRQQDDVIRILVVRHHARHPKYGTERT